MEVNNNVLDFTYDANGTPLTVTVNNAIYYYVTNIQGDVVAILDDEGNVAATYTYNAWGVCNAAGDDPIEWYNPLRYRGYVYDLESGLYYLQNRYYDPEIGRFINADAFPSTGQGFVGNNMFAYCLNSPIDRIEILGYTSEKAAQDLIKLNADAIICAGEEFGVDPIIIAGCIYAEQVLNVDWKDHVFDYIGYVFDTSIGIGQVRVSTAIMLEDLGYIEKTETIFNLTSYVPRTQLVAGKLMNDATNIRYVAAYLCAWQDVWEPTLDISNQPDILGTLYNLGENARKPNINPNANNFGQHVKTKYDMLYKLIG